jgi:hypothetical protein
MLLLAVANPHIGPHKDKPAEVQLTIKFHGPFSFAENGRFCLPGDTRCAPCPVQDCFGVLSAVEQSTNRRFLDNLTRLTRSRVVVSMFGKA